MIGYYIDSNYATNACLRIRYLNIINLFESGQFEIFRHDNIHKYSIVLFGRKFLDADVLLAKKLKAAGKVIYFDICDNYFYNPDNLADYIHYANNIKQMLLLADHITVASSTLKAALAPQLGTAARKITVIEDSYEKNILKNIGLTKKIHSLIKLLKYKRKFQSKNLNLVWFGNAASPNAITGMQSLAKIKDVLQEFNDKHKKINLTVISNNYTEYKKTICNWHIQTSYLKWDNNIFLAILKMQDAAVIPIINNPFNACKSNNRLIQAIINNVDVIADTIPSYEEFQQYCFLDDWQHGLQQVLQGKCSSQAKDARIKAAKEIIFKKYCAKKIAEKWLRVFQI